jgi:hypothetical protein
VRAENKNKDQGNRVPTLGEILPNGSMIDLVRSATDSERLDLLRWNGKRITIGRRIELGERVYEPVDVGRDVVRAINFPKEPLDCGTTRELFDRLTAFLEWYTGVSSEDLRLVVFFALASWFPEFVPSPVTMLALAQFPAGRQNSISSH